jgi:hypothetical protein
VAGLRQQTADTYYARGFGLLEARVADNIPVGYARGSWPVVTTERFSSPYLMIAIERFGAGRQDRHSSVMRFVSENFN